MYPYYIITISCTCDEASLINVYNFLNKRLYRNTNNQLKDNYCMDNTVPLAGGSISDSYSSCFSLSCIGIDHIPALNNQIKKNIETLLKLSVNGSKLAWSDNYLTPDYLRKASIILHLNMKNLDNEEDILIFRYLFMITRLLFHKHDYVVIHCIDQYYFRIQSYFSLEELIHNKCVAVTNKKTRCFDEPVSFSGEWVPAIFLNKKLPSLAILANPIIKNWEDFQKTLKDWHHYVKIEKKRQRVIIKNIQGDPKAFFTIWICYQYRKHVDFIRLVNQRSNNENIEDNQFYSLIDRFLNTSGITQILFSMLFRLRFGKSHFPNSVDFEEINEFFYWCCDLGDCITQIAENVLTYTKGGILSIRSNDNWSSIINVFKMKEKGGKYSELNRYVRVSLIDASDNSILDNIENSIQSTHNAFNIRNIHSTRSRCGNHNKHSVRSFNSIRSIYNIHNLKVSLDDLFNGKDDSLYHRLHYINPDNFIHHYGLMVYRSIVDAMKGCFTLFSSASDTIYFTKTDSYIFSEGEIESTRKEKALFSHIPGSEYDVILKLREFTPKPAVISSIISPKYISQYTQTELVLDSYHFFNNAIDIIIRNLLKSAEFSQDNYQRLKEETINIASSQLISEIDNWNKKRLTSFVRETVPVWCFYLSPYIPENRFKDKSYYGRSEIAAKILMRVMAEASLGNELKIMLFGMTENQLISFARQFALFYHTTTGNIFMKNSQLYTVSNDYRTDVLFAGRWLHDISDYASQRKLITGIASRIEDILVHISQREDNYSIYEDSSAINPFPFELLERMKYPVKTRSTEQRLCCDGDKRWYYQTLNTILETDLHGNGLGCKLDKIHIQVGSRHNDCFYEAHILFSNAYWCHVFAAYICEKVLISASKKKNRHILLCGYETYSEQMLREARKIIEKRGYEISYVIYENQKLGQSNNGNQKRIRYIDEFNKPIVGEELLIVYVMGISQTQSTLREMKEAMSKELPKDMKPEVSSITIIQFGVKDYYRRKDNEYCLLYKKVVSYLSEECPLCFPKSYIHERPLIMTNEASIIPTLLIRPEGRNPITLQFQQENDYTKRFLANQNNYEYLYYTHLARDDNHYEYYLRTAHLVHDMDQTAGSDLLEWFKGIRAIENDKNKIKVILAPMHFSNEVFFSAVNEHVFDGSAYVISFDVGHEFRESFIAKFQNFCASIDSLPDDRGYEIQVYYVDDSINTGATFNRAKSLLTSLFQEYLLFSQNKEQGSGIKKDKVLIFKAIIVLTTRNSRSSFLSYFSPSDLILQDDHSITLPVYCFLELKTPSIRSAGLMCPICRKVSRINYLISESSLTFVERHWREKSAYHRLKQLSEAKEDRERMNREHNDMGFPKRGFRRLQCSELLWDVLKNNHNTTSLYKELMTIIQQTIDQKNNYIEKVEYLISFLKVITKEDIVYREGANDAAMRILLSVFSLFLKDDKVEKEKLYEIVSKLLYNNDKQGQWRKDNPVLLYQLYQIIIARFCTMGSNVLLDESRLIDCIDVGIDLQEKIGEKNDDSFMEFLCWQIKKNLASVGNNEIRVDKMNKILCSYIEKNTERSFYNIYLKYFFALFLESVSKDTKGQFLLPKHNGEHYWNDGNYAEKVDIAIQKMSELIASSPTYKDILQKFCQLMDAQTVYMFQIKDDVALRTTNEDNYKLTILESANADDTKPPIIKVLRSEMHDFYQYSQKREQNDEDNINYTSQKREQNDEDNTNDIFTKKPACTLIYDIKDTLKIVRVEEIQPDIAVGEYKRQKCLIVYVRLDYKDENAESDDFIKQIYFAFLYEYDALEDDYDIHNMLELLKKVRGFLSFRYLMVERIEKDFKGNLFGAKADAQWRQIMLSNDRAGCHFNNTAMSRLMEKTAFEANRAISVLFSSNNKMGSLKDTYDLIYNNLIAMYYRKLLGDEFEGLGLDGAKSKKYKKMNDVIRLSDIETPVLNFVPVELKSELPNKKLFYTRPQMPPAVNRKRKEVKSNRIMEKKYLRAFLIDVFSNILKHKEKEADISIEPGDEIIDYLVVSNKATLKHAEGDENYILKGAIELDYMNLTEPHGISLGSFAHFLKAHGLQLKASYYTDENNTTRFRIKIPIILK